MEMIGKSGKARKEKSPPFSLTQYVRLFTSFREIAGRPPARFNGSKLTESELAEQHAIPISEYRGVTAAAAAVVAAVAAAVAAVAAVVERRWRWSAKRLRL